MNGQSVSRPGQIENRTIVVVLDETNHHCLRGGFGIDALHEKKTLNDLFANRRIGMEKKRTLND